MYIILGDEAAKNISSKYLVLELDRLRYHVNEEPITAYCVVDSEHVSLFDFNEMGDMVELHKKLIENYRKRNWDFCEHAIEHLQGKFKGELDSFYENLYERVKQYQSQEPAEDWTDIREVV
jgi:hypothetical protein